MSYVNGQTVRLKKSGAVVRLEDINDNPDYLKDDEVWAMAWGEHGTVSIDSPEDIEPFDVELPEANAIASEISGTLHSGFGDDLSVFETEVDGGVIYVQAKYRGLPVSFAVTVGNIVSEID